jgi:hypothetical protein
MNDLMSRREAVERTRSQLPLAWDSPEPGTEQNSSADDPIAALERVSKDLGSALKLLRNLRSLAKEPTANAAKIRVLLRRSKPALAKLPVEITAKLECWAESLSKMLDDEEARLARSFASDLDQLLRSKNVTLGGNLPMLEASFFKLEVRQQDVRVWFGPQREAIGTVPKSAVAVATYIEQLLARLTSEPFDDEHFMEQVYQAYRAVLAGTNAKSADPTRIDAVHRQLIVARQDPEFTQNQKLREYTRMQFGYDLYRLKQRKRRGKELQLVTAPRSQTVKHLDSLWVPSDETGKGFLYSHLTFREE